MVPLLLFRYVNYCHVSNFSSILSGASQGGSACTLQPQHHPPPDCRLALIPASPPTTLSGFLLGGRLPGLQQPLGSFLYGFFASHLLPDLCLRETAKSFPRRILAFLTSILSTPPPGPSGQSLVANELVVRRSPPSQEIPGGEQLAGRPKELLDRTAQTAPLELLRDSGLVSPGRAQCRRLQPLASLTWDHVPSMGH